MKKLFLVLAILVFAVPAMAQTWHTANQVTVEWDAVAPVQPTDTIKYQIYIRTDTTGPGVALNEVDTTQAVVAFAEEGRYYIGVETVRYVQGEAEPLRSATKAWSNDALACGPDGPFGVKYFTLPGAAGGLRRQ